MGSFSIFPHRADISSSESPVFAAITFTGTPDALNLLASSRRSSMRPSSRPSARLFITAVLIVFIQSRYTLRLSSYSSYCSLVNLAISADSKRRVKTLSCNATGRSIRRERFLMTNIHLSNMVSSSSSVLLNLGISR